MRAEQDELLQQYLREIDELALDDDQQAPLWRVFRRNPTPALRLRLYEANLRRLARMVLKEYHGDAPLLDMIQDAGLEMLKAIDRFDPDREKSFGAYIADLVRIQCRRTFRKLATPVTFAHTHFEIAVPAADEFEPEVLTEHAETPEDEAVRHEELVERSQELRAVMAQLAPQQRQVFRLRLFDRKPLAEICERLGVGRAQVQSLWESAFAHVSAELGLEA